MGLVEILLWWLPPAIVSVIAMLWVSWLGRARDLSPDRSDAAQERFAAAIMRDLPSEVTRQVSAPRPMRERSTGIAVRRSQKPVAPQRDAPEPDDDSRRSA
jgi:hypothetical protein